MKKVSLILIAFIILLLNSVHSQSPTNYSSKRLIGQFNSDIIVSANENGIIQFKDANLSAIITGLEITSIEKLVKRKTPTVNLKEPLLIHFNNDVNIESKISEIMKTGLFKFIEPDFIGSGGAICSYDPNDTYYSTRQWGLENDGTFNATSITNADIDMSNGWSITTGNSSIKVGVLDSGIRPSHPEFSGRIWNNSGETANGVDDDSNGYIDDFFGWDFVNNDNDPTDDHGHGTNVTGIIGANGDNNLGYTGVDWNCKLMTGKVLDENNSGFYSWWISGIFYLVDNGVDVINMSLGGDGYSSAMETAVNYAYTNNVPIVVSMMNFDDNTTYYPAGYNNVISVGATDTDNERVSPFQWGGGSSFGNHIDICAPGNYIYGLSAFSDINYNTYWSGTSQAAPLVTGVISLMKGLNNSLSVDSIKTLLYNGSVDIVGKPSEDTPGWDQYHGHGLLNAYNTLLLVNAGTDTRTECSAYTWIDGNTYTVSTNTPTWTVTNQAGCDSLVILDLTINNVSDLTISSSGIIISSNNSNATYQWLDCDNGNSEITGETGQSYTASTNGNYAVALTENSCVDTSSCVAIASVGTIENNFGGKLLVYPNPTNGNFSIDLGSKYVNTQILVTDVSGKLIYSKNMYQSQTLNLSIDEPAGIYFISIQSVDKKAVFRLIKE